MLTVVSFFDNQYPIETNMVLIRKLKFVSNGILIAIELTEYAPPSIPTIYMKTDRIKNPFADVYANKRIIQDKANAIRNHKWTLVLRSANAKRLLIIHWDVKKTFMATICKSPIFFNCDKSVGIIR